MKSIVFTLCLLFSGFIAFSQSDSAKVGAINPEYDFLYRELFNFSPNSTFGEINIEPVPQINQNFNLKPGFIIDFNSFSGMKSITLSNLFPIFNPFVNSFSITNQARYKLSDKFTLGGNSYAGNSIFNPMPANSSIQDMSIRGASMFLQYKVSKNVKLSGSFSISNQDHPFIP